MTKPFDFISMSCDAQTPLGCLSFTVRMVFLPVYLYDHRYHPSGSVVVEPSFWLPWKISTGIPPGNGSSSVISPAVVLNWNEFPPTPGFFLNSFRLMTAGSHVVVPSEAENAYD